MLLAICACATYATIQKTLSKGDLTMNKKILITYFSWGGNTKLIAQKIQSQTNADMFEIKTTTPYPTDYNQTTIVAKEQKEKNIHPDIINTDISSYDVIFVGTPAWWYTMAPPVMTFLAENDFKDKIIIPFITHGGGGKYTIAEDMAKLAKNSKVLTPFVVYEEGSLQTDSDIKAWLSKLDF